jgi:HAMP domain-containing protein
MKTLIQWLGLAFSIGISILCLLQWRQEARLTTRIDELVQISEKENRGRIQAERQARDYQDEILRLNDLRQQLEAQLLSANQELQQRTADQSARGYSITILMQQLAQHQAQTGNRSRVLQSHQAEIDAQNKAIEKANTQLRQLVKERDEAIRQANSRATEFNELAEKYNRLQKK